MCRMGICQSNINDFPSEYDIIIQNIGLKNEWWLNYKIYFKADLPIKLIFYNDNYKAYNILVTWNTFYVNDKFSTLSKSVKINRDMYISFK